MNLNLTSLFQLTFANITSEFNLAALFTTNSVQEPPHTQYKLSSYDIAEEDIMKCKYCGL